MYTVKQLADLAQVSVRTLHYYDEIGLLRPAQIGSNQYRYYDDAALLRLQQILLYRETGVELSQIRSILDDPSFDTASALRTHLTTLHERLHHLHVLIGTVENTITHLEGKGDMSKHKLFQGFNETQQTEYEREIRLEYGPELVEESRRNWGSYSDAEKQAVMDEGNVLYADIVSALESQWPGDDARVQALIERWHQHLRYFYEPPLEVLRGLPEMYTADPGFIENFARLHPDLGAYMKEAILYYVDDLETKELERLYAADNLLKTARRLQGE